MTSKERVIKALNHETVNISIIDGIMAKYM